MVSESWMSDLVKLSSCKRFVPDTRPRAHSMNHIAHKWASGTPGSEFCGSVHQILKDRFSAFILVLQVHDHVRYAKNVNESR